MGRARARSQGLDGRDASWWQRFCVCSSMLALRGCCFRSRHCSGWSAMDVDILSGLGAVRDDGCRAFHDCAHRVYRVYFGDRVYFGRTTVAGVLP